jgi:hypothetical protein
MSLKNFKLITENWTNFLKEGATKDPLVTENEFRADISSIDETPSAAERYVFEVYQNDELGLLLLEIDFDADSAGVVFRLVLWSGPMDEDGQYAAANELADVASATLEDAQRQMFEKRVYGKYTALHEQLKSLFSTKDLSDKAAIAAIPAQNRKESAKAYLAEPKGPEPQPETGEEAKTPKTGEEAKTPETQSGEPEKVETTTKGQEAIAKIQEILVAAGFAPKAQASGKNQGKHFADGRFGRLTYAALLKAHRDNTAKQDAED